eukprot:4783995-Pleurochrysis_carterae.AAC.3
MRHGPVTVRVGDQLRSPLRLELDSLVCALRHVGKHAVSVVVHRLRRERETSSQDADRKRLA